jgi:hypothetical protein
VQALRSYSPTKCFCLSLLAEFLTFSSFEYRGVCNDFSNGTTVSCCIRAARVLRSDALGNFATSVILQLSAYLTYYGSATEEFSTLWDLELRSTGTIIWEELPRKYDQYLLGFRYPLSRTSSAAMQRILGIPNQEEGWDYCQHCIVAREVLAIRWTRY